MLVITQAQALSNDTKPKRKGVRLQKRINLEHAPKVEGELTTGQANLLYHTAIYSRSFI